IFISCLQSTFSISQIVFNIQSFVKALGSATFVFDLIDRVYKIDAFDNDGKRTSYVIGDIEFSKCFVYISNSKRYSIFIARTLISNPKILLLDEAISALDTLDRANEGRTTTVIAHRLNAIRNTDSIIVIDNGEVIECGTRNKLMDKTSRYNEFVTAQ
ncbi:unnamed protein product, partial [Rotaria sp. Silwood2]